MGVITGTESELPTGSSGTIDHISLPHSHGAHTVPGGPGGQAGLAAQYSTRLSRHRPDLDGSLILSVQ